MQSDVKHSGTQEPSPAAPQRSRGDFGKLVGFAIAWTAFSALTDSSDTSSSVAPDMEPDPIVQQLTADELQMLPMFQDQMSFDLDILPHTSYLPDEFGRLPSPINQRYEPFESRMFSGAGIDLGLLPGAFHHDAPSVEEIVRVLETIRTELVKSALISPEGELQPGVAEQLGVIVNRQDQPEVHWEVFGVIDVNEESATLSIVKTQYSMTLTHTLEEFARGDDSQVEVLLRAITDFKKIHGTYLEESDGPMVLATVVEQVLATHSSGECLLTDELRDLVIQTFQDFITDGFTVVNGEDIPEELREFEAIFHVHPNGSDPSPPDIAANRGDHMPDLVIAPQEDGSVRLHLVHHGAAELLYDGPLSARVK